VINIVILVFAGGALGAMLREFVMLMVPHLADGFPLDILVANLVAAFLLGLVSALHDRQVLSDSVNTMLGTGVMGGLSTFSSFAYGSIVLMGLSAASAFVAVAYVVISIVLGYLAVIAGLRLGGREAE
jgi:fluoride exporter